MIKSMTGFGKGEAKGKFGAIKAEIRSINHKFLEMGARLPEGLLGFEDRVRELVGKYVKRGKVNLNLIYEDNLDSADKISVDTKLAKVYYRQLVTLGKKVGVGGTMRLDQLITLPGVITYEPKKAFSSNIWASVQRAIKEALKDLERSRLKEGEIIYADLKKRVRNIEKATAVIKERSKINVKLYKDRLTKSVREVSNGSTVSLAKIDKGRLEQEVALYAKNSDITEEVVRIQAHVKNLEDSLKKDPEVGKKLDFISQELNREINTVGSKASDFKISKKVIQIKGEIEKLREQAKNIE